MDGDTGSRVLLAALGGTGRHTAKVLVILLLDCLFFFFSRLKLCEPDNSDIRTPVNILGVLSCIPRTVEKAKGTKEQKRTARAYGDEKVREKEKERGKKQ